MDNPVHHIELWTMDLNSSGASFDWLLSQLGWQAQHDPDWPQGRSWIHSSGAYIVLEQSPAITGAHERMKGGLNHLALRATDRTMLDHLRSECPTMAGQNCSRRSTRTQAVPNTPHFSSKTARDSK